MTRGLGDGVRGVDDAEGRLARGHQGQRRAHVLGLRHPGLERVPEAQRGQRLLARTARPAPHRPAPSRAAPRPGGRGGQPGPPAPRAAPWATRISALPRRSAREAGLDEPVGGEGVHPVLGGGDEQVGRRPLADLLGQLRRARVGDHDPGPGGGGPVRGDLVERGLEGGCGEDRDLVGGGRRGRRRRGRRNRMGGPGGKRYVRMDTTPPRRLRSSVISRRTYRPGRGSPPRSPPPRPPPAAPGPGRRRAPPRPPW